VPVRIQIALAFFSLLFLLGSTGGPVVAADRVKKIPSVQIEIRALTETVPTLRQLTLNADRPARLQFSTEWAAFGRVRVELTGRSEAAGIEGARRVRLQAVLTLPDERRIQATREALIKDRATFLFELFRIDDSPFTLAIDAELAQSWEVVNFVSVGPPVRFEVEVFRVMAGDQTSLERNMLHTFEDQTVQYEFKSGPELTDEALTLSLTPVRLSGDLIEIKVNIAGRLPGDDDVTVLARDETLIVSRGTISPIDATVGDPPTGYRFRVKALF
jgi:hypothetical protein